MTRTSGEKTNNETEYTEFGLIYIYFIGQQGKAYIKAFDLRLEAVQHNIYYITICQQSLMSWGPLSFHATFHGEILQLNIITTFYVSQHWRPQCQNYPIIQIGT